MKYFLRTLWVIGLIPMILLGSASTFVYFMVGFPIVVAFNLIKKGKLDDDDILLPGVIGEWFVDMYGGLLGKIK